MSMFQKDLVVWKYSICNVPLALDSVWFQKDLVVWKSGNHLYAHKVFFKGFRRT